MTDASMKSDLRYSELLGRKIRTGDAGSLGVPTEDLALAALADGDLDSAREYFEYSVDEKARVPLYREAQKLVVEDAPWIFVDHGKQVIVHRKRVQGFKLHPNFDLVLTPVWLQ